MGGDTTGNKARLFGGIRIRLLAIILVAVVPLILARAIALNQERHRATATAGLNLQDLAGHAAARYHEVITEARTMLEIVAYVPEVAHGSPERCHDFLSRARQDRAWAESLWVFSPDGHAVCTTITGGLGLDVSDRGYFKKAVSERRFVLSDFIVNRMTARPTSIAILPLLDATGRVDRLLAVALELDTLSEIASGLISDHGVVLWVTDAQGTVMARRPARPDGIGKVPHGHALSEAMRHRAEGWVEATSFDGPERIYGFVQIPETGAHIAVGIDRDKVLAGVNTQFRNSAIIIAGVLVLALLTGLAIARNIAAPLRKLTAGAEAARRSKDAAALPEVTGYAEVESLSRSLAALLAELRQRETALCDARAEAEHASAEARAIQARLRVAIEAVPVGLAFFDAEERYVLWNRLYEELYDSNPLPLVPGLPLEARLRARLQGQLIPGAIDREEEWLAERLRQFRSPSNSHEQLLNDGRWLRVEERRIEDGGSIGIRIDITESKRRERSFRLLFEGNPIPMWVFDRETLKFLAVNDAAVEHYGYSRDRFLTMTILDLRDSVEHEEVRRSARTEGTDEGSRVWRHRNAEGREILVTPYARPLQYEGRPAKLVALIDITDKWRDEAHIRHLAHYDGLTELANRTFFRICLERALANRRQPDDGVALICIDLDGFKDVNDTLGHPVGDELLRNVAQRLRGCVREQDTAARIGGDEFAVVQDGIVARDDARALAERLIAAISAPYMINGHEITITCSVGIATTLHDADGIDDLLNHADMALYRAKSLGRRSHCFFAPEMDAEVRARRSLEADLREAFEQHQFEVHYQPWVELRTGTVEGFEALLRWSHPLRGNVSPAEFIPVAEDIGLIIPIGRWVLERACADAVQWPNGIKIAVNLSPVQFRTSDLVATVQQALAESGLAPERLELEITETVLLEDNASNLSVLHALRGLGVKIAMDDFGTGYSSLGYLRRFPFDKIKIDRSFVSELPHSADCLTITRGIADLAAGLGMTTIAEGIETVAQHEILGAIGCTHGQGYLFGKAMPADRAAALVMQNRTIRAA